MKVDGLAEGEHGDDLFGDGSGLVREPTAEDAFAAAALVAGGYIKCALEPWHQGHIGRITSWPESKPLHLRSSSCRCYMHPGCTVAKARSQVSDAFYMHWLFSKKPPPKGTPQPEMKRLVAEHFKHRFAEASSGSGVKP